MNGVNKVALPAWLVAVATSWAVSFELGAAATLGLIMQWTLKAPAGVQNWVPPLVAVVAGIGLYVYVLGHRPTSWPVTQEWLTGFITWVFASLGVASATGRTGGAPKTDSL